MKLVCNAYVSLMTGYKDLHIPGLEHYVRRKILLSLKKPDASFTLQPTDLGNRNSIFFLDIDNVPPLILKGYRKKSRFQKALRGSRLLSEHAIRVPRLYFADSSQAGFKELGCYFVCEERIAGTSLTEYREITAVIPAVARGYAKMHQVQLPRWRRLLARFRRPLIKEVGLMLQHLAEDSSRPVAPQDAAVYMSWFRSKSAALKMFKSFSLCHGDVNRKNILISESGDVVLIDHEAVKFLPFPIEFFRLEVNLCEDRQDLIELFESAYGQSGCQEALDELSACRDFFKAYVLLEFACYFARKQRQYAGDDKGLKNYYAVNAQKVLSALSRMIST